MIHLFTITYDMATVRMEHETEQILDLLDKRPGESKRTKVNPCMKMITPRFRIEQSDKDVTVYIHAPYTDINNAEIHIDGSEVCFYSSPYYLRLHLPGSVLEDDRSKGSYDAEKGEYIIVLSKAIEGEFFEGLDMINSLINPPSTKTRPNIEILGGEPSSVKLSKQFEDFDWFIEQKIDCLPSVSSKYGFGNLKSGAFTNLQSELPELLDIPNPDTTPCSEREALQIAAENTSFNAEHYLGDWAEEKQTLDHLIRHTMPWEVQSCDQDVLTTEEQNQLLKLKKIESLPLSDTITQSALLGLAELVFCWAYEQRCSLGDPGPESARSIRRLSATLSWLRSFQSLKQLVLCCVRRALCVPLYRNWNLAMKVLSDTRILLKMGRMKMLKTIIDLYTMFEQCESYYIFNQLYIEPYCLWIQEMSDGCFVSLAKALEQVIPIKADIGWELDELELAGKLALEEQTARQMACDVTSKLHIYDKETDSDDSEGCETESSSGDYTCSESESMNDDEVVVPQ